MIHGRNHLQNTLFFYSRENVHESNLADQVHQSDLNTYGFKISADSHWYMSADSHWYR